MSEAYYKGYWMVTNRCNLRCSYCVLENASHQLRAELDLAGKKELISHLYHKLNFRRLTLSGGEVLIIGKSPPNDFIELLRYLRQFRSPDPVQNLEIELYTNGTFLDEQVAFEMEGVVDLVAITIDSSNNEFLTEIGRNNRRFSQYYNNAIQVAQLLAKKGIKLKLHSVVGQRNHLALPDEVLDILVSIKSTAAELLSWKFYQYMSYDFPRSDMMHAISASQYEIFIKRVKKALEGQSISLHFKDNEEMNASLFNILSYGNAQYMRKGDTWSTSPRTQDLRSYASMQDLFSKHDVDQTLFRRFHQL